MKRNWQLVVLVVLGACLYLSVPAVGHNSWLNYSDRPCLQFEVHKPSFEETVPGVEYSGLTVMMMAYVPISRETRFVVEIPVEHASDGSYGKVRSQADVVSSETAVGNPYLGISWSKPGSSSLFEIGGRLPLMSKKNRFAAEFGVLTLPDRLEAFVPKTYSIQLMTGYRYESTEHVMIRLLAGPTLFHQDAEGTETEVSIDHRIEVWADLRQFFIGGAYAGRFLTTEDVDFSDRFTGQFMLAAGPKFSSMQVGANLIIPMDDFISSVVNVVYGVNCTFFFPTR